MPHGWTDLVLQIAWAYCHIHFSVTYLVGEAWVEKVVVENVMFHPVHEWG